MGVASAQAHQPDAYPCSALSAARASPNVAGRELLSPRRSACVDGGYRILAVAAVPRIGGYELGACA
eukprot:9715300-Alexandrium_andersonii.AAC.1